MNLEFLGKILTFGWGPDVIKGFIPAYLGAIDIDTCLEYIRNEKDLLAGISEKDWAVLRGIAEASKIDLSMTEIVKELQRNRPDVLAIILSHPKGMPWLQRQIDEANKKLAS